MKFQAKVFFTFFLFAIIIVSVSFYNFSILLDQQSLFYLENQTLKSFDIQFGDIISSYALLFGSAIVLSIFLSLYLSKTILKLTNQLQKKNTQMDTIIDDKTKQLKESLEIIDRHVIRSTTDTYGYIIDVSEAFCKISEYKKEELIGQPHSIVRHPEMQDMVFKKMWETISLGKTWSGVIKNRTKSGGFYWVKAFIEPQFDKDRNIIAYTAVRTNITDKILLQDQSEKYDAIIRFANSGIGTMDLDGNFLSVNHVYTELFGYTQEEMIGKNCLDMTTEESFNEAQEALINANKNGVISRLEKSCYDKHGNHVYIEFSLNKLPDNNSFVVVINSLEDKRKLELTNELLSQKVMEEVARNTRQMEILQEEQLKSVKLSSIGALAAGITHEINTPLTYIKGNFELMQYDIEDLPSSSIKQRIEDTSHKILDGISRVANIVESMREVSQASSEMKTITNIYSTIITSLTISQNAVKSKSRIFINGELFSPELSKDKYKFTSNVQKQRIEQVWIVLINNALDELVKIDDYEKRALHINLEETEDKIKIYFADNAGGIPEDILENIFEPFVSTKESGGIGVGLNIAKKIINEQKGEIIAYNKDGGAVFEITLHKVIEK